MVRGHTAGSSKEPPCETRTSQRKRYRIRSALSGIPRTNADLIHHHDLPLAGVTPAARQAGTAAVAAALGVPGIDVPLQA